MEFLPPIEIRKAFPADAEALSAISEQTFRDTYANFNTPENMDQYVRDNFGPEQLSSEISSPENTFLLAVEDGNIIGFSKLCTAKIPEALAGKQAIEIERIYVDSHFHGKKVGPLLMQHIVDFAQMGGFEVLWLGVWENNPRAFRFYEKWGFTRFGEQIFQLGDDLQTDWLLAKKLDENPN